MKSEIQQLMKHKGIDVTIIMGKPQDPSLLYFAGNIKLFNSIIIIRKGEKPLLIHHPIDRDEAQKSTLQTIDFNYFELYAIQSSSKLDRDIKSLTQIFNRLEIKGKVAFYGTMELSRSYPLLKALSEKMQAIEIVEEEEPNILSIARATKDNEEIEAIRNVSKQTSSVMGAVKNFLQHLYLKGEDIVDQKGRNINIGEIKKLIRWEMFNRGLLEEVDTICALGEDSGIPHNYGENQKTLRGGQTLVIDMFPRSQQSGYFYDITRTFCLGWVPEDTQKIYADILEVLQAVESSLKPYISAESFHQQACRLFEHRGYKTILNHPQSKKGFVHSLGHGIGLDLHERPFLASSNPEEQILPGMVFTLEPGLYFPDKGIGIRLEDVYYINNHKKIINLTDFPREMFIPLPQYS